MQILYQKNRAFPNRRPLIVCRIPVSMSIINDRFEYQDGSEDCGWIAPTVRDADGSNGLVRMAWKNIRDPMPPFSMPTRPHRNRAPERVL